MYTIGNQREKPFQCFVYLHRLLIKINPVI